MFENSGNPSALITYTTDGKTRQSAGTTSLSKNYDLLDFLGEVQSAGIDILPITWQAASDQIGEGGTARILQATFGLQNAFAFKQFKYSHQTKEEHHTLRALIAEVNISGILDFRESHNLASLEGICWDMSLNGKTARPVLVFEKSPYGDLSTFMATDVRKAMDFADRSNLLFGVASAVKIMHQRRRFPYASNPQYC